MSAAHARARGDAGSVADLVYRAMLARLGVIDAAAGELSPAGFEAALAEASAAAKLAAGRVGDDGHIVVGPDADHFEVAQAYLLEVGLRAGELPVYALGSLWEVDAGAIWRPVSLDQAAIAIAQRFAGRSKLCRRAGDFSSIARVAAGLSEQAEFFDRAPAGVAGPASFHRITGDGEIVAEPLTPAHRQRMRVTSDPVANAPTPLFDHLLAHAFGDDERGAVQRRLLQQLFGAAIARSMYQHRVAALFLGPTTTGKSTILQVLRGFFPPDQVAATSPQRWSDEYYLAGLAGKAINLVGELDPDQAIPGGAFKSVVGVDVIEGRHPTHRPFSFVCTAAHFFNANKLPPTVDRSDAFFRRWRVVAFTRAVADDEIIVDLAQRILDEEAGGVVGWLLDGAADVARCGGFIVTDEHRAAIERWRNANNSAVQFLLDDEWCIRDPSDHGVPGSMLYAAYRKWAAAAGVRAFGRTGFYDAIDEGAGRFGITRHDDRTGARFAGVGLVVRPG